MRILVTGGAGFIGSHTVVELQQAGYDVVVLDNLCNASEKVIPRVEAITGKKVPFYKADILDREALEEIFSKEQIDAVIHFAGLKAVGESVQKPWEYYENNIAGTLTLVDVMRKHGVKSIIFSSSATVYGNPAFVPITEECPKGQCTNPYGWTKSMLEQILTDIQKADPEWNVILLRYFNPIGAHKSGLIGALQAENTDEARGRIENIQEFLGVVDEFTETHEDEDAMYEAPTAGGAELADEEAAPAFSAPADAPAGSFYAFAGANELAKASEDSPVRVLRGDSLADFIEWVRLRTLVLPETIKELPDMMLAYCQQLETFVCYAPLESTGGNQFMLCRSLNNVIFVNGVREIDNYAFDSAGPLGNLYFGEHLIRIGQQAFNFAGLSSFVADAERVEYGAFTECKNLTSLHFTSKMKDFGENCIVNCPNLAEICFDGCDLTASPMGLIMNVAPKLTVRVPEGMSEENLRHAQNCQSWSENRSEVTVITEPCAHAKPTLPDLPALLPTLKLDASVETAAPAQPGTLGAAEPEIAPEPTPIPEPVAQSAGIPDEYLGVWYGVRMEIGGTPYPLADMGLDVTFTIGADGAAEMNTNGDVDSIHCVMQDGVLMADGISFTLQDALLTVSMDGVTMTFSREKPEASSAAVPSINESAIINDFRGFWTLARVTADGITLPAEAAEMAGDTLVIYGTVCDLTLHGTTLDGLSCRMDNFTLLISILNGETAVTLREDGTLSLEMSDLTLWYERTGDAPEAAAEPTAEFNPAVTPEPAAAEIMLEKKYVMTDADVSGYNMTAAQLGNYEYSLLFHEDGTVKLVIAGADIPGLTWVFGKAPTEAGEVDGIVINYYTQALYIVPTEKGCDMDYFGSMLIHFAPEESAK